MPSQVHGFDDLVEPYPMLAVARQCHAGGVDGLERAHRIALNAWHLHQAAYRVAGQAQVTLHSNFSSAFDLLGAAAHHRCQSDSSHRAGHADLALATDFRAADRHVMRGGPPLWDDCDAQMDDGVHIKLDWDLAALPAPDYCVDQRTGW